MKHIPKASPRGSRSNPRGSAGTGIIPRPLDYVCSVMPGRDPYPPYPGVKPLYSTGVKNIVSPPVEIFPNRCGKNRTLFFLCMSVKSIAWMVVIDLYEVN